MSFSLGLVFLTLGTARCSLLFMSKFDPVFMHILKVEGKEFSHHPDDAGGPTKFGITLKAYKAMNPKATAETIQNLTEYDAKVFYLEQFWKPLKCDSIIDDTLRVILFDQAVNRGISRVVKTIQKIIGVKVDGIIGGETLCELNFRKSKPLAFEMLLDAQKHYIDIVKSNPSQIVFLHGWLNRLNSLFSLLIQN